MKTAIENNGNATQKKIPLKNKKAHNYNYYFVPLFCDLFSMRFSHTHINAVEMVLRSLLTDPKLLK